MAPIPRWTEPDHWARLPIRECGEPLVPVLPAPGRLFVHPIYAALGIPDAPTVLRVRSGVRERLHRAAARLPDGVALRVADGHRPLSVQRWLWDDHAATLRRERPELDGDALDAEVRRFVAAPVADPACPPPHRTGGAVDVTLCDARSGDELDLGAPFDAPGPGADTRHLEEHPADPACRERRRLLFHALTAEGFANYLHEWWHYDFGNQRWANVVGADAAVYGIPADE